MESRHDFLPDYKPSSWSALRLPYVNEKLTTFLTGRTPLKGIWSDNVKRERCRTKSEENLKKTRLTWEKEKELFPTGAPTSFPKSLSNEVPADPMPAAATAVPPQKNGLARLAKDAAYERLVIHLEALHELDEDAYRISVRRISEHFRAPQSYENETPQYVATIVHHMRASVWHLLETPKPPARTDHAQDSNPFDDAAIPHGNDPSTRTSGPQTSRYLRKRAA